MINKFLGIFTWKSCIGKASFFVFLSLCVAKYPLLH